VTLLAAGASGPPEYLQQIAALLGAAAVIGYLCARLRVVPIVGFLLAGVLIGPSALGVVDEREVVDAAAEVGVILLLFTIGIEFSIARLLAIRRTVLLGGSLQVGLAVGAVTGLCVLLGVEPRSAVFTGLVVSLSSTALVLKLLADRGATSSPAGQTALGLLVFQDLAVVAMVLLVPVLGSSGGDGGGARLGRALLVAAAVVVVTLVVARRVMPRVLEAVARACSPEVFLLAIIGLCLGTAYLTALAGVSVSLGAFLAGLVVSESRHSTHALAEVLPLQIIFSAVFFLSIGTLLDVGFLLEEPLLVLAAVAAVLVIKVVTTGVAARAVGLSWTTSISVALLLAQVGEFAFVLERAGAVEGLSIAGLGERGGQAFLAATVLLLLATPGLAALGRRLPESTRRVPAPAAPPGGPTPQGGVLVSGWGPAARELTRELAAAGVPVTVTTLNPDGAAEAERAGLQVVRGDSTRAHVLHEAGVAGARVVVVADDAPEQAGRISSAVATAAPHAHIVVLAEQADDVAELHQAGAGSVVLAHRAAHDRLLATVRDRLAPRPAGGRTVVDTSAVVSFRATPETACVHAPAAVPVVPSAPGCVECLRDGERDWVHLRLCTSCGHVGCCDSSPARHAASHAQSEDHPVMCSLEPGESWGWCYLDASTLERED
jgi:CPA2 family monovalent cation:H+ antiporter-2